MFCFLGSYPLSTLTNLFLHIFSIFICLFFHISLNYLGAFNHLGFLILASLVWLRPFFTSQPWAVCYKASAQSGIMSSNSSAGSFILTWIENLLSLYNFSDTLWHATHTIHVAFLPCFVYLKTQVYIQFVTHVTYAVCHYLTVELHHSKGVRHPHLQNHLMVRLQFWSFEK